MASTCTALLPPPPREQAFVQKCIFVTRYREQKYLHNDPKGEPNSEIWIVDAGEQTWKAVGRRWCPWIKPAFYEEKKAYDSVLLEWIAEFDRNRSKYGFSMGRPMTDFVIRLPLCTGKERPRKLYRAIHSEHLLNGDGTCARGFGKIQVNPLTFQIHLQKHMNWHCKELSPFMSATPVYSRARRVCAGYQARGYTGIEILIIDTTGPEWDDTGLFHSRAVVSKLGLEVLNRRHYIDEEYLIQYEIPKGKVKQRVKVELVEAQYSAHLWKLAVKAEKNLLKLDATRRKRKRSKTGDADSVGDGVSAVTGAVEVVKTSQDHSSEDIEDTRRKRKRSETGGADSAGDNASAATEAVEVVKTSQDHSSEDNDDDDEGSDQEGEGLGKPPRKKNRGRTRAFNKVAN